MILADTSVWIAHLRSGLSSLATLLEQGRVLTHPLIIGEVACGQIRRRTRVLQLLSELPSTLSASNEEVLRMIEDRKLWGKGIGIVDFHLLASTMLTGCQIWSTDHRLSKVAAGFKLDWKP